MSAENDLIANKGMAHLTRVASAWFLTLLLCTLSTYIIWGWVTIEDINKYCTANKLDFNKTLTNLIPDISIEKVTPNDKGGYSIKNLHMGLDEVSPIYRFLVPFNILHFEKDGFNLYSGALLQPFIMISENSRNIVFCFGIGYLVGILIVGLESLRNVHEIT